jgi:hypothetical protein
MLNWLLFICFALAVAALIYSLYNYMISPRRKLESAWRRNDFYFLDEPNDTSGKLFITYRGILFEGTKSLGTTEQKFTVTLIKMKAEDKNELPGLTRDDFYRIEYHIQTAYPEAEITWEHPVQAFLKDFE